MKLTARLTAIGAGISQPAIMTTLRHRAIDGHRARAAAAEAQSPSSVPDEFEPVDRRHRPGRRRRRSVALDTDRLASSTSEDE